MNDILLNPETNEIAIKNGDFDIGRSDEQHQSLLLMLDKGSLKQFPAAGVGIFKFLESEDPNAMLREIRQQFAGDGMKVNKVTYDLDGKLNIDAIY